MTKIPIAILSVVLAACAAERSEPADQAASSSPGLIARTSIDTPLVGGGPVKGPSGFSHERNWSHADSIVGEFMLFSQRLYPDSAVVTSDTVPFPAGVRVGQTTAVMLKGLLGEPAAETRQDGMLVLQYNSPFIGADEAVNFHLNGNILRKVTWTLYSD
jgi:hypothetical protein